MHETGRIPNAANIADPFAIHDVLVRHSRGVDRGVSTILVETYVWQGPPFEGLARGTRGVDDPLYGHLGA